MPGSTERDKFYWRDVGTIDSFFDAHQDLIAALPIFNLYNREWPIFSQQLNSPPAKFVRDAKGNLGTTIDSIVSLGTLVSGGHLERSVHRVVVRHRIRGDASSTRWCSIGCTSAPNATVRRAILDKDVVIAAGRRSASTTTTIARADSR